MPPSDSSETPQHSHFANIETSSEARESSGLLFSLADCARVLRYGVFIVGYPLVLSGTYRMCRLVTAAPDAGVQWSWLLLLGVGICSVLLGALVLLLRIVF